MKTAGPMVAALAALALLVVVAEGAPAQLFQGRAALARGADISSNWSGYVATGPGSTPTTASPSMTYTDVTGQWIEPKASCAGGSPTAVAIWVGLGGYSESSNDLEQTGTSADCAADGTTSYYAWYELVPADSVTVAGLKVMPGDVIASTVLVNGNNVLVQVTDRTRKTRFTKHLTMATPDQTSAEWIVEAPTQCGPSANCKQLALTDFGSLGLHPELRERERRLGDDLRQRLADDLAPARPRRNPLLRRRQRDRRQPGRARRGNLGAEPGRRRLHGHLAGAAVRPVADDSQPTVASALAPCCSSAVPVTSDRGGCSQATTPGLRLVPVIDELPAFSSWLAPT